MLRKSSLLERPLNFVFSAPSHIAILRALMDNKIGMSGRAIAREAFVNHQTCFVALGRLENLGIIEREKSDRTQLVRLNFYNHLVRELLLPLLHKERNWRAQIRQEIAKKSKAFALSATLFGSAARRETEPGSDIDLLLIVPATKKSRAIRHAQKIGSDIRGQYGIRLSPIVMTLREAHTRVEKSDPLLRNILREGIDLLSPKLREIIL